MTRGRHANHAYLNLDHSPPGRPEVDDLGGDQDQLTAGEVLTAIATNTAAESSAHEAIRVEQDRAASVATLAAEAETIANHAHHTATAELLVAVLGDTAFGAAGYPVRRLPARRHRGPRSACSWGGRGRSPSCHRRPPADQPHAHRPRSRRHVGSRQSQADRASAPAPRRRSHSGRHPGPDRPRCAARPPRAVRVDRAARRRARTQQHCRERAMAPRPRPPPGGPATVAPRRAPRRDLPGPMGHHLIATPRPATRRHRTPRPPRRPPPRRQRARSPLLGAQSRKSNPGPGCARRPVNVAAKPLATDHLHKSGNGAPIR